MNVIESLLRLALDAVGDACRVARQVQGDLENIRGLTKDDRSPVTVADFAVQAIVALALRDADPATHIVGEENADALRGDEHAQVRRAVVDAVRMVRPRISEDEVIDAIDVCNHDCSGPWYWALDPIDGTKGFLRGQQYAIALGRVEGGRITMGVMGCPNLPIDHGAPLDRADPSGTVYFAAERGGAWQVAGSDATGAPVQIHAATIGDSETVRVCESVERAHSRQSDTHRIIESIGSTGEAVRLDSQCKYAVVARGQADAYLRLPTRPDYRERIWDHAAGMMIATEAGATVTDITGDALDFSRGECLEDNRGIVCAGAGLHDRLIRAIDELGIAAAARG